MLRVGEQSEAGCETAQAKYVLKTCHIKNAPQERGAFHIMQI